VVSVSFSHYTLYHCLSCDAHAPRHRLFCHACYLRQELGWVSFSFFGPEPGITSYTLFPDLGGSTGFFRTRTWDDIVYTFS
jgi:hypothetical protein